MSSETIPKRPAIGIGARLTLWGAGLTCALLAIMGGALYAGMFYSMRSQIDVFLEGEIHEFLLTVEQHPGDDASLEAGFRNELGVRARHDLGFRLIDSDGRVFVSSAANDVLRGLWRPPASWFETAPRLLCETLRPPAGRYAYRVCSLRTRTADGRACTAQSSYLLDQMTEALARFRRIGVAVLLVTPLIALAVGGFLARRALRPVRSLIRATQGLGAADLRTRVPLAGTGDEMDQLAATLNGMLNRIEQKVREVQRFTADASHELRTPLTALRGGAELALLRRRSPEDLRQTIEESIQQYDRLQHIADDLLLLTRLDAREAVVRKETVSLDGIAEDATELYGPIAEEKGLSLVVEKSGGVVVHADGGRLRQVIGNLLDNAIKYTPSPGRVSVSVAQVDGAARIVVTDTGVGISPEDLPRVFDRFYRADPSRSAGTTPGAGLGLSICQSIVAAHGGMIGIESEAGRGTTVTIRMPLDQRGVTGGSGRGT